MCLRLLHLPSVSLSVKSIYLIDFRLIFSLWFFGSVYICIYNYVKQGSQILENSLSSKYYTSLCSVEVYVAGGNNLMTQSSDRWGA